MTMADRIAKPAFIALVAVALAFVTLPSVVVVIVAFGEKSIMMFPPDAWSLRWFERALTYPDFRKGMVNGLYVSAWASLLSVAVGTLAAYAIDRFAFKGRALLEAILLSPLVIPHFTLGVGLLLLASTFGLARGYSVVVLCHLILVVPFVMRSVYVSLKNIDPMLERAAASLGASPLTVFLRIHLPLLAPGLAGEKLREALPRCVGIDQQTDWPMSDQRDMRKSATGLYGTLVQSAGPAAWAAELVTSRV